MTNLNQLDMASIHFTGILPSELGSMTSLTWLDLASNHFIGTIPSEVGLLTLLRRLDLSNLTMVTGPIPTELSLLTYLSYLDLSGSSGLSGTIPHALCFLQNLSCTYSTNPFGVCAYSGGAFAAQVTWDKANCSFDFDCSDILCGCDCPCWNGTESTSASNVTDDSSNSSQKVW